MADAKVTDGPVSFIKKHKKLSVIIASVILLAIIATVLLLTLGNGNSGNRADSPITNGENSVVYYYDLPESAVLLTLTSDWKFTLDGPYVKKSGSYSLDDANITLDFVRENDETSRGTVSEDKIVLVMNGATLTFRKMIDFTVTFNSNGGSAVESVKVTNGKTLNAPTAPTKDDSVFLGWYTDEALTKSFGFGSSIITKDVTLYAKWS